MRAGWLRMALGCAVLATSTGVVAAVAPVHSAATTVSAPTPKTALFYGDSLTWESAWSIQQQMATKSGWTSLIHAFSATAPCLWLQWLPTDLAAYSPSVVELATAGNGYSASFPCLVDANGVPLTIGSPEYYARYQSDIDQIFALVTATGAKVVFVLAPPFHDPVRDAAAIQIGKIAKALAANYHGVSITGSPRATLAKNGKYIDYKPCLASETAAMGCANGVIPIRTLVGIQAGLHLCPAGLPTAWPNFCLEYSSGEYRFGKAIANATVSPPKPILP